MCINDYIPTLYTEHLYYITVKIKCKATFYHANIFVYLLLFMGYCVSIFALIYGLFSF